MTSPVYDQAELDNVTALLEESEKKGVKLVKEVDKLNSKLQDLEVQEKNKSRGKHDQISVKSNCNSNISFLSSSPFF